MLELSLVEVVLPGWPTASTHTSRTHFPRPLRTADSQVPAKDSCAPTTETRVGKLSPLGGQKARSFMMCFNRSRAMMARGMPLLRAFTTCHLRYTARCTEARGCSPHSGEAAAVWCCTNISAHNASIERGYPLYNSVHPRDLTLSMIGCRPSHRASRARSASASRPLLPRCLVHRHQLCDPKCQSAPPALQHCSAAPPG